MPYKGIFWGGHSYAWTPIEDAEDFASVADAGAALVDRYLNRSGSFPCVGSEAVIDLYAVGDDGLARFDYPDVRVTVDPTRIWSGILVGAEWQAENL